jgi:RNA polymerase sigma-70 factor (ECF subfamily)
MQEREIIQRCQEGDVSAYKLVYDRYEQPLLRTALRMLRHREDAEDAVQVAFIKLYRGIQKFRYDSKFSTYLFRILMNVCFDQLEKKRKMRMQVLDSVNLSYHPRHDLRTELEEAIHALPEQQRACFVLFAIEELKQSEIAEIMGLSLGGVKSNIYHAKARLRGMLSDDRIQEKS